MANWTQEGAKGDRRTSSDPWRMPEGSKGEKRFQWEPTEEPSEPPRCAWRRNKGRHGSKRFKKASKSELLKKGKIELSLQPELNPACPETPQMQPQNRVADRKHKNQVPGSQENTIRGKVGTRRDPVPPWGSRGSTNAPALG